MHTATLEASLQQMITATLDVDEDLLVVVSQIATMKAAKDELHRALRSLAGAFWEVGVNASPRQRSMGVFMPSNNVLYAYVLYVLIPALYTDEILVRSSSRSGELLARIHWHYAERCPEIVNNVIVCNDSQREFC